VPEPEEASTEREREREMDSDEEDFVFVGTPIQKEEEVTTRKKRALAETSGHLRTLPAWKQEVHISLFIFLNFSAYLQIVDVKFYSMRCDCCVSWYSMPL